MTKAPSYPFEPKSNAYLKRGQFWGIPLSDGRWGAGLVLGTMREPLPCNDASTKTFLAALLDWVDEHPPTRESVSGRNVLDHGWAHVRTIRTYGRELLGEVDWSEDDDRSPLTVTHRMGPTVWLYRGASPLRPATADEAATLPVLDTWGFSVIALIAEHVLVKGLPISRADDGDLLQSRQMR